MVVFEGNLTGEAKKFFIKKKKTAYKKIIFLSLTLILPIIELFRGTEFLLIPILLYVFVFLVFVLLLCKEERRVTADVPKKISFMDEYIICLTDTTEETRRFSEVKYIYDFGEFYYIEFLNRNSNSNFICQKNLISKGSIREFEVIFESLIIKK